jgi:heterodisulfide reductase subunit A
MEESNPIQRAKKLADWKVNKLICGGIDGFCTRILTGMGIEVIPWVTGNAQEFLEKQIAGLSNSSKEKAFFMEDSKSSPTAAVMVVGAGISGIQTALDLANSGFLVYLVERSSGIGGIMPQLDKTFPTNECSL